MGIAKRSDRRLWNSDQDIKLAELAPHFGLTQLAKRMKLSIDSGSVRMKRRGLKKADRADSYILKEVCEVLGRDHEWVRKRIFDRRAARPAPPRTEPEPRQMHVGHRRQGAARVHPALSPGPRRPERRPDRRSRCWPALSRRLRTTRRRPGPRTGTPLLPRPCKRTAHREPQPLRWPSDIKCSLSIRE